MSEMGKLENMLEANFEIDDIFSCKKIEENDLKNGQNIVKIGDFVAI